MNGIKTPESPVYIPKALCASLILSSASAFFYAYITVYFNADKFDSYGPSQADVSCYKAMKATPERNLLQPKKISGP